MKSIAAAGMLIVIALLAMYGEGRGQGRANNPPPPSSARSAAPFDPTGYWSSLITQNWRLRMVPPGKGDYIGIPISAAGKRTADAWDQAKDEAAGNQCRAYGAPGLMNLPTHLRITWQDDNTLRVDTDYGTQTRILRFTPSQGRGAPSEAARASATRAESRKRSWQGNSVAAWASRRGGRGGPPSARYLRIATTDLLSGYLRKNGVPYGENASLLEYVDLFREPDGAALIVWTAVVDDPVNLETPYIISSQFKKLADGSAWQPTACSAGW